MINFKTFLLEIKIEKEINDKLLSIINRLGYNDIKTNSKFYFSILTNKNRIEVMKELEKEIQKEIPEAKWDISSSGSSIGNIVIGKFKLGVKPKSRQGKSSFGLENEMTLFNILDEILINKPINIIFSTGKKEFKIENAVSYKDVGNNTKNRKKADIIIFDDKGKKYFISIKKDNAENWESADSYYADKAKKIIDKLISQDKIKLEPYRKGFKLNKNIGILANKKEIKDVVFGSDILGNGCVIKKTFDGKYVIKDENVIIKVSEIITNLSEIPENEKVYFLIRNDITRNNPKLYKGIRILAVMKSRINKSILLYKG